MPKAINSKLDKEPMRQEVVNKDNKFSNYNKKKFLRILKNTNCNAKCEKELVNVGRQTYRAELIKAYINEQANICQERVSQVMEKESNGAFVNLNDWAHMFTEPYNCVDNKDFCVPLIIEMISKTELCPQPEEMNGVDLRNIYGVIANLMAGYPTEELNRTSKEFLDECYKDLIDEVNIEDVGALQSIVDMKHTSTLINPEHISDCDNGQHLAQVLQQTDINPLRLPVSLRK